MEEKFKKYVEIQESRETNMFAINNVIILSEGFLDEEDCLDIMKNYSKYEEQFSE